MMSELLWIARPTRIDKPEPPKPTIMSPTFLDWKISPKIERYRVLGLGERDPEYEGSFILPVSTSHFEDGRFRNRRRRMHIITRKFYTNATYSRGLGKERVVAAVTAISRGGELLPPTVGEIILLRRRLVAAKVPKSGYYESGLGARKFFSKDDMMWASMLCNNKLPPTVNVRDMPVWDGTDRARVVLEQIFGEAVPSFAGYIFFNTDSLREVFSGIGIVLLRPHRRK